MDFTDWRKTPDNRSLEKEQSPARKYYGKRFEDYVSEQIREAEARGEFDNLPGFGKPLSLDDDSYLGDKAMSYRLLKSNGFAPGEIELAKEISREVERIEAKLTRVRHQGKALRSRRVPPFASEKRSYNALVEKTVAEYDKFLRDLNRKILTLNLSAPVIMHKPLFEVEKSIQQFREECPLLE